MEDVPELDEAWQKPQGVKTATMPKPSNPRWRHFHIFGMSYFTAYFSRLSNKGLLVTITPSQLKKIQ